MSWSVLLLVAAASALLLVLAAKLRGGGGRGDLIAPPGRRPRRLSREEMERLMDLIRRGEEEAALRQLKSAGYEDAGSQRLVRLMVRLAADGEGEGA